MDEDGCSFPLFFRLLVFLGLLLLWLSLSPRVACYLPNSHLYIVGCFCVGLGLIGHIGSLVWFRLDWGKSPVNRHWLCTWPIIFGSLMFVGVVAVYLPVQFTLLLSLGPNSPQTLTWHFIHLAGVFCLVAGLLTSVASMSIRRPLLEQFRPLGRKENLQRGLLLLGLVLVAGGAVFAAGIPNPSYCQAEWDCALTASSSIPFDTSEDVCASQRYSLFWPPIVAPFDDGFCQFAHGGIPLLCLCRQNRCVPNPDRVIK